MTPIVYSPELKAKWDEAIGNARNATFLFYRDFMDYHRDRFEDCSLLFNNSKGKTLAAFPANFNREAQRIDSHGGLTYGGLLLSKGVHLTEVKEMLKALAETYLQMGAQTLRYKPIPHIYHTYPTEEDLYWLFRSEATLTARAVSTCIDLKDPLPFSTLRKRKIKKAQELNPRIIEGDHDCWVSYWKILSDVLQQHHHTHPVHSLSEILLLAKAFPEQIKLFTLHHDTDCLAGCVVFDYNPTVHIQYIAASDEGKEQGALDYLFDHLIDHYQNLGKRYFDFGISTEDGGSVLNEGLLFQKEGFGGRAICYDTYDIDLNKLAVL